MLARQIEIPLLKEFLRFAEATGNCLPYWRRAIRRSILVVLVLAKRQA